MTDERTTPGGERLDELPDHEIDDERTVGGGVMSQGGTAIDTGTGTLSDAADSTPSSDVDPTGEDVGEGEQPGTLGIPNQAHRM